MTPISVFDRSIHCRPDAGPPVTAQQGFTLLELLLVLGILGMAAMLLGPGLATLDSPGFNAQTREATGLLNYARRMAVVQGTPATIEFLSSADEADIGAREPEKAPTDVVGRWRGENITLSYRDSAGQDMPTDRGIQVTFYPEGGSTGGELTMRQDNRRQTISVDPFSGRVQVLDED
ncbi:MAG: type II secretion system protein GspH [Gammaproteobacteria bacterium]|nr:type II secretion system protein GspH [Gammaproteobacteria bacterium]